VFTLPVKARSARTRLGRKCTVPSAHPRQVRCAISPATSFGYVDVRTRVHMPCKQPVRFSVRFAGTTRFVRQRDILSANACS
jgi:hypothetical protein